MNTVCLSLKFSEMEPTLDLVFLNHEDFALGQYIKIIELC
jgi:hypothetical protein